MFGLRRAVGLGRTHLVRATTPGLWRGASKITRTQPIPEKWDKIIVPARAVGLDPDLNWTLVINKVAPQYQAHRNLDADGLIERGAGQRNAKSQSIDSTSNESESPDGFVFIDHSNPELVDKVNVPADKRFPEMPSIRYSKLTKRAFETLSDTQELFVQDFVAAEQFLMRVITDDPTSALFMQHIGGCPPSLEECTMFEFCADACVVYHATQLDVVKEGFKMNQKSFSVFEPVLNTYTIGGTQSKQSLVSAISALVSNNCWLSHAYDQGTSILLEGDSLSTASGTTIVLGAPNATRMMDTLSSAHSAVVKKGGDVVAVFRGVARDNVVLKLAKDDLHESVTTKTGKFDRVTKAEALVKPSTTIPKLSNVVLVVDDASNTLPAIAQLTKEQAFHHFLFGPSKTNLTPCYSSFACNPVPHAKLFADLVTEAGAAVYLLNQATLGDAGTKQALKAISQGTKGTFSANKALEMSVCSQLAGVDANLLKSNATAAQVKTAAQQRAEALVGFHEALSDDALVGALPKA